MKLRVLVCGICLVGSLASAQVGNWQVQIQETNGARGKGFGYLQVKQDGTMVGYSLTTTTYGVVTFGGNWSIQSKKISGTFTESLDGQEISGTFKGTFTAKSFSVKVLLDDGSTSTLSGKPVVSVPNASGTFSGSVKQSNMKSSIPETFTASANADYPGVLDFSGTVNGALPANGQVLLEPNGIVFGYGVTDLGNGGTAVTAFTGKYTPRTGVLTTTGVDAYGVRITGKFTRQ